MPLSSRRRGLAPRWGTGGGPASITPRRRRVSGRVALTALLLSIAPTATPSSGESVAPQARVDVEEKSGTAEPSPVQWVGRFEGQSGPPPPPWQTVQPNTRVPPTHYGLRLWDGVLAVEAVADASMALLVRPLTIDLAHTPILCWRWRVDAPLASSDMATKAGDDFAARVYIAFRMSPAALDIVTRVRLRMARLLYGTQVPDAALSYVWDGRYPVGTSRPNAYTDRVEMIVLRSGSTEADRWVVERRDVQADAVRAFGDHVFVADLLAVASDTDNTGARAHAGFADLQFVARQAPCAFPLTEAGP